MGHERPLVLRGAARRLDDLHDRQVVALRELEVPLVVGRDAHDRAGPVLHQDVVGDPDRDAGARGRIDHEPARRDAVLFLRLPLDCRASRCVPGVVEHLPLVRGAGGEPVDERVLGGEEEERGAEDRVRPRREHVDVELEPVDPEEDVCALGAADPVSLHRQDALGPRLEQRHVVEEHVRVGRDPEQPLLELPRLDLGAAALAAAVDHLLVREHGLVVGAPLDRDVLPVREVALEEAQEEPLRPAVVLRVVGGEHPVPVDRPAEPLHLAADPLDVALGHLTRVAALPDRRVLRWKAEGVEAHRAQHLEPMPPSEVGDDLAEHVVPDVAHMELAGRVRQHLEHVRLGLVVRGRIVGIRHGEGARLRPHLLPLRLDHRWVVSLHRRPPGTKKPLDREAVRKLRGAAPRSPPALQKKLLHTGKTVAIQAARVTSGAAGENGA